MCANSEAVAADLKSVGKLHEGDVEQPTNAHAPTSGERLPIAAEEETPPKKRKTRRGKNKRRQPYAVNRKCTKVVKPEAPHNSNAFLIEDHGNVKELEEKLENEKLIARTRDSSFSVDSDGEFYSSPDDEEEFLIKDFDDQYESLHAERLNAMSKSELIQEYMQLEKRVDVLTKRLRLKSTNSEVEDTNTNKLNEDSNEFQKVIERLTTENETLKKENDDLKSKMSVSNSDSEDTESDSSDSCSSCSSGTSVDSEKCSQYQDVDYSQTNGHSPNTLQPV